MRSIVPDWLGSYERQWLPADFIAGLTVAALVVPEGMAYAQLAGVPAEAAFYAAPIGLVLYAFFGSSRQLVVAVSGAIAVLSASIVGRMAEAGSEEFIALTAALAIAAGMVSVAAGWLKLGRIAQFFSESVLTGFIFGLALVIMIKQVPKMMGIESEEGNFFERLWHILRDLGDAHGASVIVGIVTLVLMLLLERYFERIPAALVALVGGILAGNVLNLAQEGVEVLGEIPSGLAAPAVPDIAAADIGMLIIGGMAITLVAFAEAVGPAREFAAEHGYEIDENRELVGIGAGNLGAGFFQGFSIGSSLSKSAANDRAGAKSPLSLVIAAIATAVVALFFTATLENLPEPTLGAIVIVAVSGMLKVPQMRRLWVISRRDFAFAATALMGVLVFDTLPGLAMAVLLSLGAVIWRAATPTISTIGRLPGRARFVSLAEHPDARTVDGMLMLRLEENLFFANAASIRSRVKELISQSEPRPSTVVLDVDASVDIDVPACDQLRELAIELKDDGLVLALTRVKTSVRGMFDKTGVANVVGSDQIYDSNPAAVAGHASRAGVTADPDEVATEASVMLAELARLLDDDEITPRLRRAIEALETDTDTDS